MSPFMYNPETGLYDVELSYEEAEEVYGYGTMSDKEKREAYNDMYGTQAMVNPITQEAEYVTNIVPTTYESWMQTEYKTELLKASMGPDLTFEGDGDDNALLVDTVPPEVVEEVIYNDEELEIYEAAIPAFLIPILAAIAGWIGTAIVGSIGDESDSGYDHAAIYLANKLVGYIGKNGATSGGRGGGRLTSVVVTPSGPNRMAFGRRERV